MISKDSESQGKTHKYIIDSGGTKRKAPRASKGIKFEVSAQQESMPI